MCELFAMSSLKSSNVNYSLNEFARHGGSTYSNRSGWGIAYFADRDAFLIKEPEPASDSPWVEFVASQDLQSTCVIAHVRLATVGEPTLHNTHPFRRALGGHTHVFAHNGTLRGLHERHPPTMLDHQPVGDTDSELAFCLLLDRLASIWRPGGGIPPLSQRMEIFAGFAAEMLKLGSANFLYSDSNALFVHGHRRIYEENGEFSEPRAPGLSMRDCLACQTGPEYVRDGLKVGLTDQHSILFASVPLDEQGWTPLPEGTAIAVENGVEMQRVATL